MHFDPDHLKTLSAILRSGSFEAAAAALHVTPSAVSQRIKQLEEHIGSTLITRATPCVGTPAGVRLAKLAHDIEVLERQTLQHLTPQSQVPHAHVTLAVNADSLATWFTDALAPNEGLTFQVRVDDQDHSTDWLKRGSVSAAVTSLSKPARGCACIPLGSLRYIATASPEFMKKWFAQGVDALSLAQAPCMSFTHKDQLQNRWIQHATGQDLHPPTHFLPSTHSFVDVALRGMAWGMNPEILVADRIANGRLMPLIPNTPLDTALFWQISRLMEQALSDLTLHVRRAARQHLILPAPK